MYGARRRIDAAREVLSDDPRLDPNPPRRAPDETDPNASPGPGAYDVGRRGRRGLFRRVGRAFGAGRRGWRRERPMRRDPDGTTGPIRTVACFGDRSTSPSTARSNRRGDPRRGCRGGPPREGERAKRNEDRRVDERRATRRASTVTARVVRYEGTSMERWTTRARVGDGRRARVGDGVRRARKRHPSVFHSDWNGEGYRRGTRAVLAPFDSTAHRPSSKTKKRATRVFRQRPPPSSRKENDNDEDGNAPPPRLSASSGPPRAHPAESGPTFSRRRAHLDRRRRRRPAPRPPPVHVPSPPNVAAAGDAPAPPKSGSNARIQTPRTDSKRRRTRWRTGCVRARDASSPRRFGRGSTWTFARERARGRLTRRLTRPLTRRVARPRRRRQKPARFGGRARDRRVPALDVLRGARIGVVANAGDEIVVRREFDGPSSRGPRIGSVPCAGPPRRRSRRGDAVAAARPEEAAVACRGTRRDEGREEAEEARRGGGEGVPKRRRRRRRRARVAGDAVRGPARRGDASRAWGRRDRSAPAARPPREAAGCRAAAAEARLPRTRRAGTRAREFPRGNPLRMLLVLDGGEPLLLGAALRRGHGGC